MSRIILIGAVRGLISEGEKVKREFNRFKPNIIAISVSREAIQAMAEHTASKKETPEPANLEEEIYIEGLSEFGDVVRPPPCYSEAWKLASQNRIPIWGLDMDDEHFTTAYCKYISTLEMVRQGRNEKKWTRYAFYAKTPQEFVIEWDALINRMPGYQALERAREEWIAKGICALAKKYDKVMAVVELERLAGVQNFLQRMECEFQMPD